MVIIGLQLWLPLNDDTKNYGLDGNAMIYSAYVKYASEGIIGSKSLGSGKLEITPSNFSKYNDFTLSFWSYPNEDLITSDWTGIIGIRDGGSNLRFQYCNNQWHSLGVYNNSDFKIMKSNFDASYNMTGKYNRWVHSCITSNNNVLYLYVDGNLISSVSLQSDWNNHLKLIYTENIGKFYLSDFRLYDSTLSPKQIKLLSQAMICHYPMGNVDGKIGGRNLLRNSSMNGERLKCDRSQSCNSTTTLAYSNDGFHIVTPSEGNNNNGIVFIYDDFTRLGINIGDTITFSLLVKGSSDSNKPFINIIFQNDGTTWYDKGTIRSLDIEFTPTDVFQKIYVTYTLPTDKKYSSKTMFLGIHGNMKSDLYIKNLKLEKSSTSTPYTPAPEDNPPFYDNIIPDISGYQNNGEVTDSACPTWSNDSPRYLGSYEFNGKNQYISGLSPISNNTKEFTIAFWVKLANKFNNATFFSARTSVGCGISLFLLSGGRIRLDDNKQSIFNNSFDFVNKWVHLCITRNTTNKKLYINGKLIDTLSDIGDMQNIGKYFTIGGSEGVDDGIGIDNFLNGKLSDFRIYSTDLSDEDVLDLYQSSASLDSQGNLILSGEVIE